jgi:hypothetical protein
VRKLGVLIVLAVTLSSCGFPQHQETGIDPCIKVRETAQRIVKDLPDLNEVGKTAAKLEVLKWAFIVTGDSQCFSGEVVATAKSAITLIGSNPN